MIHRIALWGMIAVISSGCSLDSLVRVDDPEGGREIDRSAIRSYSGAIDVYYSSLRSLTSSMSLASQFVGVLTDELQVIPFSSTIGTVNLIQGDIAVDSRTESLDPYGQRRLEGIWYNMLHGARTRAFQARQLLQTYGTERDAAVLSHLWSIEAFAVLLLAEHFCSGTPLTTVPFEGDVEYTAGLTTDELLERAVELFDSSLAITHDSTPVLTFARVGKARALLGLGDYQSAAAAVAGVSDNDVYTLSYTDADGPNQDAVGSYSFWTTSQSTANGYMVSNFEGGRGLQWLAPSPREQDPRLPITTRVVGTDTLFTLLPRQRKFEGGTLELTVASGIQARMIEAEAQLNDATAAPESWLNTINNARRTIGLVDTTDPGTHDQRVDLIFRERAMWLYLTGTRLGDMRRLVRQYQREAYQVYPSGAYMQSNGLPALYGEAYVFSPRVAELELNNMYTGCASKNP